MDFEHKTSGNVPLERERSPYSSTIPASTRTEPFHRPEPRANARSESGTAKEESQKSSTEGSKRRRYGPRTCRICLDVEHPKFPTNVSSTFGIAAVSSRPVYESDDPELGRLLSPCKCKGSSKYVHEGCLDAWRLTSPGSTRNFWQCPTCKFTYRLSRLHWASMLSSRWAQMALTLVVLIVSIFILGFIADPILDLWFDPVGAIADTVTGVVSDLDAMEPLPYYEPTTWLEHFTKGFFSLGLVGAVKSFLAMGPWHWLNFRAGGLFGSGRRRGSGRGRMDNFNILFVLIGAFTFLMAVWKFVKALSARVLANMSNKVMDVGDDDGDEDEVDAGQEGDQGSDGNRKEK